MKALKAQFAKITKDRDEAVKAEEKPSTSSSSSSSSSDTVLWQALKDRFATIRDKTEKPATTRAEKLERMHSEDF